MEPMTERPVIDDAAESKGWTAEELLALSPAERFDIVNQAIVTDIDQVPPHMIEAARVAIREHIAENESTDAPDQ